MHTLRKLLIGFAVSMTIVLPVFGREMSKPDFQADTIGQESKAFRSIIGRWHIDKDGLKQVYTIDGRKWEKGKLSQFAGDKAAELYGKKGGEFIRNIEAYGEFPEGRSYNLIVETAGGRGVDLIVMGVPVKSALEKLFTGSATEKVLGNAGCAVLIVKGEASVSATV